MPPHPITAKNPYGAGRPTEKKKTGNGPYKPIDWNKVKELIKVGEPESRICAIFNCDPQTFIIRLRKEFPEFRYFNDFAQSIREEGLALLRLNVYKRAMQGNVECIKHLNKHMRSEWDKVPEKEPDEQKSITLEQELLKTQYELMQLKEQLGSLLKQTGQELQRSDSTIQHLGGSDQLGQNTHINQETDRTAEEWSQGGCSDNRCIKDYDPT